jgi:hypothetical protein
MSKERTRQYYWRSKDYVPTVYKEIDLAYFAGIIDGEGCFCMYKCPQGYIRGCLKIDNTDKKLIDWIEDTFTGYSSSLTRATSSKKYTRDIFSWVSTGDHLLDISEQVLPYLVIKKAHCENMIKFRQSCSTRTGNKPIAENILAIRQACLEASRKLNSRYHLHPLKGNL